MNFRFRLYSKATKPSRCFEIFSRTSRPTCPVAPGVECALACWRSYWIRCFPRDSKYILPTVIALPLKNQLYASLRFLGQ